MQPKNSLKNNSTILSIGIILLLFSATVIEADNLKLRVIVKSAEIMMEPNLTSAVIKEATRDTILEFVGEKGEWYLVKLSPDTSGFLTYGYVHHSVVEVIGGKNPKEVAPTKKPIVPPEMPKKVPALQKNEIVINIGYPLIVQDQEMNSPFSYNYNWSMNLLENVNEDGKISMENKRFLCLNLGYNHLLIGNFGFALKADYNVSRKVTGNSLYNLEWKWENGVQDDVGKLWDVTGDISTIAISGNLLYKFPGMSSFNPYFDAGLSYFIGKAEGNTFTGYGITWESTIYQYIDFFDLPLRYETSITGIGINIGAGASKPLSPNISLNIDVRYFLSGTKEADWEVVPGTYNCNNLTGTQVEVTQGDAYKIEEILSLPKIKINPSFFRTSVGLSIMF